MNILEIPFSRFKSFFTISTLEGEGETLFIRSVHGGDEYAYNGKLFAITLLDPLTHEQLHYKIDMKAEILTLNCEKGWVSFAIEGNSLFFKGEGVGLNLQMPVKYYEHGKIVDDIVIVDCYYIDQKYALKLKQGELKLDAPWLGKKASHVKVNINSELNNGKNEFEGQLTEYKIQDQIDMIVASFDEICTKSKTSYERWQKQFSRRQAFEKGFELATYITWSCVVPKGGLLTRDAMYMSKNWMTNIWSWDHCFNAMALGKGNPKLAWDQLMIMFDHQDDSGVIPDFINDKISYFACTKPPVHGWAFLYLYDCDPEFYDLEKLNEILAPLMKWTDFWLNLNGQVPYYNHGNDSGWDNSTLFKDSGMIKSPDLIAYLLIQIKAIEFICDKLGKKNDLAMWENKYEELYLILIEHYWSGEQFTLYNKNSSEEVEQNQDSDCLQLYMPLILGQYLPADIRDTLVGGLLKEDRFLTNHGLATESIKSKYYQSDGYWRGPIWAPATMIIVDGLRRGGYNSQAQFIADKFIQMANEHGMAENYDALTGVGLRDTAFTWTSSTFLILSETFN